jgi:hypothetical protein
MGEGDWDVEFERSGGFAGIVLTARVRTSELDETEAKELSSLAGAVDFGSYVSGSHPARRPRPDRFTYHLSVRNGRDRYDFDVPESEADPALRRLIAWLEERARGG